MFVDTRSSLLSIGHDLTAGPIRHPDGYRSCLRPTTSVATRSSSDAGGPLEASTSHVPGRATCGFHPTPSHQLRSTCAQERLPLRGFQQPKRKPKLGRRRGDKGEVAPAVLTAMVHGLIGGDCERGMRGRRSRRWTRPCLGTGRASASCSALLRFVRGERLVEAGVGYCIPWRRSGLGGNCARSAACAQTQQPGRGGCNSIRAVATRRRLTRPRRAGRSGGTARCLTTRCLGSVRALWAIRSERQRGPRCGEWSGRARGGRAFVVRCDRGRRVKCGCYLLVLRGGGFGFERLVVDAASIAGCPGRGRRLRCGWLRLSWRGFA